MMRITFVLPSANLSGGVRVVAIYAERLKQLGHQVFIIAASPRQPTLLQQIKSLVKGQGLLTASQPEGSHLDNISVDYRIIDTYRPVTDADVPDADVVVATWWETAEWVANLSPTKGAKAYFIQHYEVFDYLPKERVKATWKLPLHKIVISKWLLDLAQNEYGDTVISHVPNSVDTDQFHALPRDRQAVPTVGLLYSPIYWKGCEVSLQAIAIATKQVPNLHLVAFGTTPVTEELPLPSGADYFHKPSQDFIKQIYSRCDVWLCGSWSEGFHLPPLEAMACRCPVVSTQVGGPIDIVTDGVNGYLVPVGDVASLAERLVHVLTLPGSTWKEMSDAAYATATSYTWDDATKLFEAALLTAINREQDSLHASRR